MASTHELHVGQTVEWYDTPLGGCATGKVENVSHHSGWVTVRLNALYVLAPWQDAGASGRTRRTHTTMRAHQLTPRD